MTLLVNIIDEEYERLKRSNFHTVIEECVRNGTVLPDNATNGDVVEKVFGKDVYCTLIRMMYSSCCEKLKDWWNAKYQKGSKE